MLESPKACFYRSQVARRMTRTITVRRVAVGFSRCIPNRNSMPSGNESVTIALEYPFPDERIFRYRAMQDVLSVLVEEPYDEFTVTELATMVEGTQPTVSKAVALLAETGAIETSRDGRKQYVRVDRERLDKPDPVLSIPQSEFHRPVRAFVEEVKDGVDDLVGVVLFGSVARGTADRASDVDLLVIVDDDRTAARRMVQSVVSDLQETTFDGDRYGFQAMVESVESARRVGERLREQFEGGITLVGSEKLSAIRRHAFADDG